MAKRLRNTALSSCILLFLVIELFSVIPAKRPSDLSGIPNTLSGLVHFHLPPGMQNDSLAWIAPIATRNGIDFIVSVNPESAPLEAKRLEKTDFFFEEEVNGPAGDLFVYRSHGRHSSLKKKELSSLVWDAFEGKVPLDGFFSQIAHPSHVRAPWNRFDRYTEGIEVLNLDSQWVRELYDAPFSFLGSLLSFPFNQFLASLKFLNPFGKDLSSWDNMNALSEGHFGVLAHDLNFNFHFAEGSPLHEDLLEKSFRVGRNVLFLTSPPLDNLSERRVQIYQTIREGRMAVVLTSLYPFSGNDWTYECDGFSSRSGARASFKSGCSFQIKTPAGFPFKKVFKIYRNGELTNHFVSEDTDFQIPVTEGGAYRLEVWARTRSLTHLMLSNDTPYLLYNPIYVH